MPEEEASVTLYRVGPLPSEAALIRQEALAAGMVSAWIHEAQEASGANNANGRWFTSDRDAADWYVREHPDYQVRSVTVSAADAAGWKAADHPSARRFASNPGHEFFLPTDVADKAMLATTSHKTEMLMENTDSAVVPLGPGTTAAFKQRREAYLLTDRISSDVDTARSLVNFGMGKTALYTIAPTIEAIEKNPEAQRLVGQHRPGMLQAARGLRTQAEAIAKTEVDTIQVGTWQSDMAGALETRVSLGKSDQGYHYMLEVSHGGGEPNASWSPPFETEKDAAEAGSEAEGRIQAPELYQNGDREEREGVAAQDDTATAAKDAVDGAPSNSDQVTEAKAAKSDTATDGQDLVGLPETRDKEDAPGTSSSLTAASGAATSTAQGEGTKAGTSSKGQDGMNTTTGSKPEIDGKAKQAAAIKRADDFWKGEIAMKSGKTPAAGQTEGVEAAAQVAADKKRAAIKASA